MKILVVDDSMLARMVIKETVSSVEGVDIFEATNGKEALKVFKDISPDVMFLDLTMPEMGGEDVLRRLRALNHSTRIFVISADMQKHTAETVMSLGAHKMLKKPPPKEEVVRLIEETRKELT